MRPTPTIRIICWTCKHYDAYNLKCRKTKNSIHDEDIQNCYNWQAKKKSVGTVLYKFYKENEVQK